MRKKTTDPILYFSLERTCNELFIYNCGLHICKPLHFYGPTARDYFLLHFVVSGKGTFKKDNKVFHLEKNQGFFIKPGEITYYQADKDEPWEYYFVAFNGSHAKKILSLIDFEDNCIIKTSNPKTIINCLKNMQEHFGNEIWVEFRQVGELYVLLSTLIKESKHEKVLDEESASEEIFNKAVDYIHQNFAFDITVAEIARYVGLDRTNLYRKFMKKFNISPQEYILGYRLEKAAAFLVETKLTNVEIALSVGMGNYPNFCKMFKRRFDRTPSEYKRKNYKNATLT